jgi:signal transduction histidine kinase
MKLSLPLRILIVHLASTLAITLGIGALLVKNVQEAFDRYRARWIEQVETFPTEQLFLPMANEAGRALLESLDETVPVELQEAKRRSISEGLGEVLEGFPGVTGLFILDTDSRIRYVSDPQYLDLAYTTDEDREFLARSEKSSRTVTHKVDGRTETHLLVPVYDEPGADGAVRERTRLGSILVVYEADPDLLARLPEVRPPTVEEMDITLPVVLFIAALMVGGLVIGVLTVQPVRRLAKALSEYKARGYRGGLQAGRLGESGDLADTVRAINELGGKLEAMVEQGREREALLATLSQSLEEGMVAVGPDGVPLAWNPAALRILTGMEPEDAELAEGSVANGFHEADSESVEDSESARLLREALERNPALVPADPSGAGPRHDEVEIVLESGATSPARITRVMMETRPGEVGTLLVMRDLATFRKVKSHLLEAGRYAVLAHLAAGLAHEIRNPLHAIGINAGVVEEHLESDWSSDRVRAMSASLSSIRDETRRLTDLLNNYLGLVRPNLESEPVDLREICRRVVRLLSYTAKRSGVTLTLAPRGEVPMVEGISDRLQQAVLNLVLNAIEAMSDGGTITLGTSHAGREVRLTVTDTGPGIPAELEHDLFDLSVTTKLDGTGLGLPLVRHIAESHGGAVTYRSVPGKGTEFTLSLPVRAIA